MGRAQDDEKRKKRNQLYLGVALVLVMIFSIVGFGFQVQDDDPSGGNTLSYNGYSFVNSGGFWIVQIGQVQFSFLFSPQETPSVGESLNKLNYYVNQPLYISSESYDAQGEILRNLDGIVLRIQEACTEEEECPGNFPIKTCEDNFIVIREGNLTAIEQNEGCVYITGPSQDLPMITDEFLYKIIGIKN